MLFSTIRKLIPFVNSYNHMHNKLYNSVIWGGGGGGGSDRNSVMWRHCGGRAFLGGF